ncbi:hypothetical protein DT73_02385 [Mangrovibacter sp. MFB070]|uniref:hypothetical protein n=1 Tax=Mangrovibacter sp. MFB070 TaxID=1224318 RepID=UPI0004D836DF|nr:hypothetical protein [Mangrovibacter sp. MFB070]KEA54239.1 hypothetical protein DT73_02385 [Mangrovibacter sp. MFB070]
MSHAMAFATVLDMQAAEKINGGSNIWFDNNGVRWKEGPYGLCYWRQSAAAPGSNGWYREATNKDGTAKRCDEK